MNSKDYWAMRAAQDMTDRMGTAEQSAAEMNKAVQRSADYIAKEVKAVLRGMEGFGIPEAEAKYILRAAGDGNALQRLRRIARQIDDPAMRQALTNAIDSAAAYRWRIKRMEELYSDIDSTCRRLYQAENRLTTAALRNVAEDSYYHTMFNLQQGTGLRFSFSKFSRKDADRILRGNWLGGNYSQRIWRDMDRLSEQLKRELLVSVLSGRSGEKTARLFRERFGVNAYCARRIVRTESAYVANAAHKAAYEEAGIEQYRFIATLDSKTSEVCAALDGKVFEVSKAKPGTNCPPMHPFCRSTTIAEFGDDGLKDLERRAKDENGETVKVPADMTYQEWYGKYVEGREPVQITTSAPTENNSQFSRSPSINRELEREFTRRPNRTEPFDISAFRVDHTSNNIFISGNATAMTKPKDIHELDLRITESFKLLKVQDSTELPAVCIASVDEMVNNVAAAYNAVDNVLFVNETLFKLPSDGFACPNNRLSTILHECIHWKDAADYRLKFGTITVQNYQTEYLPYLRERCRISLDRLEKKGYNIYNISSYATDRYFIGAYDETYTEYRVNKILGGE